MTTKYNAAKHNKKSKKPIRGRSAEALAAILQSSGGAHQDKRRAPEKKHAWRREEDWS